MIPKLKYCILKQIMNVMQVFILTIDKDINAIISKPSHSSSALLSVRPGGDVVYSTCSLSTLQNDGVVQGAIIKCQEEFDLQIQVVDLSPLATCLSPVFKFSDITKYGQLVIPDLTANFGPMYFARLHKKA